MRDFEHLVAHFLPPYAAHWLEDLSIFSVQFGAHIRLLYAAHCPDYFLLALLQLVRCLPWINVSELLHDLLRVVDQLYPTLAPPLHIFTAGSLARLKLHVAGQSSMLSLPLLSPSSDAIFPPCLGVICARRKAVRSRACRRCSLVRGGTAEQSTKWLFT